MTFITNAEDVAQNAMSRRTLLTAGVCTLFGASGLLQKAAAFALQEPNPPATFHAFQSADDQTQERFNMKNEQMIRNYYSGWDKHDWSVVDAILADDFTFTSPNGDNHISKSVFKSKCWHGQEEFIQKFDLEIVLANYADGFAKYICHTTKGSAFCNVEYFRFADGKVSAIESYFGGDKGYPSVVATGKS